MNAIEIRNAGKTFGVNTALDSVCIEVPQGYVTGLVGPNGAGKTTLLRSILNLTLLDSGSVTVLGMDSRQDEIAVKDRVGFVHEESYLFPDLTARQHERICQSAYSKWSRHTFDALLKRFQLPESAKIRTFSKGMRMRFQLAISLCHEAELIVMDEPASGLDPVVRRELTQVIAEEMEREKRTFLISTHLTTDLDRIADYIIVLNGGRVVLSTDRDQIAERFALCKGGLELIRNGHRELFSGIHENAFGFTALTTDKTAVKEAFTNDVITEPATVEDIVFHLTGATHESTLDS
jgi:ABC-2 type transport system ATP-binding protein